MEFPPICSGDSTFNLAICKIEDMHCFRYIAANDIRAKDSLWARLTAFALFYNVDDDGITFGVSAHNERWKVSEYQNALPSLEYALLHGVEHWNIAVRNWTPIPLNVDCAEMSGCVEYINFRDQLDKIQHVYGKKRVWHPSYKVLFG